MTARGALVVALAIGLAALAGGVAPAVAQSDDAGVPDDAGGPDAGRVVIDGPTLLGIGRPQVSAMAAPSEVRLGDKLTLFIEVTYDEQVAVSVPAGLGLQPTFDELRRSSVEDRRTDGTRKRVYQIQLQVWDIGDLRIPPIEVTYTVGRERSWVVTNEVPVRVVGTIDAIDDPDAFLGATPPVALKRRDWRWIIGGIAVGLLATGGLIAWIVSRRKPRPPAPVPVVVPAAGGERADDGRGEGVAPAPVVDATRPREPDASLGLFVVTLEARRLLGDAARRALDALDALERSGAIAADPREGFRALVQIIHTFAVEQYHLPPRHRTSSELVIALGRTAMPPASIGEAAAWLARCDRVKFGAAGVDDRGARALSDARALVVGAAGPRREAAGA